MQTTDPMVPATPYLICMCRGRRVYHETAVARQWGSSAEMLHWQAKSLSSLPLGRRSIRSEKNPTGSENSSLGSTGLVWQLTRALGHHLSHDSHLFSPPLPYHPVSSRHGFQPGLFLYFLGLLPVFVIVSLQPVITIATRKIILKLSQITCPSLSISLREKPEVDTGAKMCRSASLWTYLHYSVPTTGHLLCLPLVWLLFPRTPHLNQDVPVLLGSSHIFLFIICDG